MNDDVTEDIEEMSLIVNTSSIDWMIEVDMLHVKRIIFNYL
jgi:hypothetical protein